MDLFTPTLPAGKLCEAFRRTAAGATAQDKALIASWSEGLVDRDGKFVQEFQSTFHSSFWELYLHACLRELGLTADYSHARPDFVVTAPVQFCVEAVTAQPAGGQPLGGASPPEQAAALSDLNELNRKAIVRLANAFASKWKKYRDDYANLSHVRGRPFVLAMAAFDSPAFFALAVRAIEALLYNHYVDEEAYFAEGKAKLEGSFLAEVMKDNGAGIPLGVFNTPDYADISAVIYNPCATWGKVRTMSAPAPGEQVMVTSLHYNPNSHEPHKRCVRKEDAGEGLLDGLFIFHNPFAKHPLDPALMRNPSVAQAYTRGGGEWVHERPEGHLTFRTVFTAREQASPLPGGDRDTQR